MMAVSGRGICRGFSRMSAGIPENARYIMLCRKASKQNTEKAHGIAGNGNPHTKIKKENDND